MANAKQSKDPMDVVLANIEKSMGHKGKKSTFARFGNIKKEDFPVLAFGIQAVDDASYCGGVPRGKMVEIYGPESSGKSLLTLCLIANAQKNGLECALIDIEQSFDPSWAKKHGVDVEKLVFSNNFDSGENALEYAYQLCKTGAFGVVVIDSTAALTPLSELEGTLEGNARVGEQARLLSRGCRKIVKACGEGNTTCIFVNQTRMKIGVMYGNPETTPGGLALKFYSHQRIRVQGSTKIKVKEGAGERVVGQKSTVTFVKNKTAPPLGKAEFQIIFDETALNPVVMLCNALKTSKLVSIYKGLLRIKPDVLKNKKPIETGMTTMTELADYIVKNNQVISLLDALIEEVDGIDDIDPIDDAILELKEDPSKIVSPVEASLEVEAEKVDDATEEELGEDLKEAELPEELPEEQ